MMPALFNLLLPLVLLLALGGTIWTLGSLARRSVRQNPLKRTKALLVGGLSLLILVGLWLSMVVARSK
jgi:hypothetical protein